jgi:hypothetical protein
MDVTVVGGERFLTKLALKDLGVIAALEDPEPFDQAVEELSMRASLAWDTLDRWEQRAREIVRGLLSPRAI